MGEREYRVPKGERAGAAPSGGHAADRGLRVAVIDNDPSVLSTLASMLSVLGHAPSSFGSAEAALAAVEVGGGGFDVVLSDVDMPGMSGVALAAELARRCPGLPVILLTGWGAEHELMAEVDEHVRAILTKPITLVRMRGALADAVSPD